MARNIIIPVRLTQEDVDRFDRLVDVLAGRSGGMKLPRSEVMRASMERGLPVLEAEVNAPLDTPTSTPTAPTKRTKRKR